jgi:hypothetical protein
MQDLFVCPNLRTRRITTSPLTPDCVLLISYKMSIGEVQLCCRFNLLITRAARNRSMQWLATMFARFTSRAKKITKMGSVRTGQPYLINASVNTAFVVVCHLIAISGIDLDNIFRDDQICIAYISKWEYPEIASEAIALPENDQCKSCQPHCEILRFRSPPSRSRIRSSTTSSPILSRTIRWP